MYKIKKSKEKIEPIRPFGGRLMPEFLARRKKTKTKRPVSFETSSGEIVSFRAKRRPKRRYRVEWCKPKGK